MVSSFLFFLSILAPASPQQCHHRSQWTRWTDGPGKWPALKYNLFLGWPFLAHHSVLPDSMTKAALTISAHPQVPARLSPLAQPLFPPFSGSRGTTVGSGLSQPCCHQWEGVGKVHPLLSILTKMDGKSCKDHELNECYADVWFRPLKWDKHWSFMAI